MWLLSLAVADFTFSLLLLLPITELALDSHWPFGLLLCKLNYGALMLCLYASIFTLAAISVDRCISVVLPVWSRNHRGPRLAALLSLGVWVAAAALSAPTFTFRQLVSLGNRRGCYTDYLLEGEWPAQTTMDYGDEDDQVMKEWPLSLHDARYRAVSLAGFLLGFLLPFLVITTSYSIIVLRLRWGHLAPSGVKPFKFIAAIILAFLLCWMPYHICSMLDLLLPHGELFPLVLSVVFQLSYILTYFNICINPVLYIFTWQDFRDAAPTSCQLPLG
uniref:chemerin-like receptor 1 n=1 Tax=Pristiophorus japonicus TaxID=55135 RepID=UPI00398EA5B7